MKNVVFVVLFVAVIAAGYAFINNTDQQMPVVSSQTVGSSEANGASADNMPTEIEQQTTLVARESTAATAESMLTPSDMPEQAQDEMYGTITAYNKCMMQNRLEYHQQGVRVANVADKTLQACEPHLDELKAVLEANDINVGLRENMVKTMRSRAARKLMAAVMQSIAGQAAAMANSQPEASPATE